MLATRATPRTGRRSTGVAREEKPQIAPPAARRDHGEILSVESVHRRGPQLLVGVRSGCQSLHDCQDQPRIEEDAMPSALRRRRKARCLVDEMAPIVVRSVEQNRPSPVTTGALRVTSMVSSHDAADGSRASHGRRSPERSGAERDEGVAPAMSTSVRSEGEPPATRAPQRSRGRAERRGPTKPRKPSVECTAKCAARPPALPALPAVVRKIRTGRMAQPAPAPRCRIRERRAEPTTAAIAGTQHVQVIAPPEPVESHAPDLALRQPAPRAATVAGPRRPAAH